MSDSYATCPSCGHRRQINPGRGNNPLCRKCSNATRYNRGPTTTGQELRVLIDAMTAAERDGHTIPCKDGTNDWTSDLVAETTTAGLTLARQCQAACRHECPVLQQCTARRDAAKPGELYGIIAGRLIRRRDTQRTTTPIDPSFTTQRVLELQTIGWTTQDIATRYNVSPSTVKRHLRKANTHRQETAA